MIDSHGRAELVAAAAASKKKSTIFSLIGGQAR
jgi:hypothetical protein